MMKLKRLFALMLAVTTLGTLALPAAAETTNPPQSLSSLSGAPIDKDGKQYDAADTAVAPGQTIYFLLPGDAGKMLGNDRNVRLTVRKTNNSKYLGNIYLTERILTSKQDLYYSVPNGLNKNDYYTTNSVQANKRNQYVAVELKDYTGPEEIRVDFDLNFTVRRDSTTGYAFQYGIGTTSKKTTAPVGTADNIDNPWVVTNDKYRYTSDRITLNGRVYVGNKNTNGSDTTVMVGGAGKNIKVASAQNNFVSFDTSYDTIATLEFMGSSNPDDFIARLSTKWPSDLLSKFRDTDAFIWKFSPANIDCDSRAKLTLKNPFNESYNPKRVYIYSVDSRGLLKDVSRNFTYDSDEDVYITRTRNLGTYIVSDVKVNVNSPRR